MTSTQQKALAISENKGPWIVIDRPIPKPGKGEVLVKIHAAALNPVDWKVQKYGWFTENMKWPAVQGSDASGQVVELGEGVTTFAVGDRVVLQGLFTINDYSSFQQFALIPTEILAKIPSSMSYDEASTIPVALGAFAVGMYDPRDKGGAGLTPFWEEGGKGKYAGQAIVILGGSSSVGQYGIQIARESGFSPIITTSSIKHADYLKSLGATHVVDRKGNTLNEIKSILPGGVTDIVLDAISSEETQLLSVEVSKPNATVVVTLPLEKAVKPGSRSIVHPFGNVHAARALGVSLYKALPDLLESGAIKPNKVEILPGGLQGVKGGLDRMLADQVSGVKLVVRPWE